MVFCKECLRPCSAELRPKSSRLKAHYHALAKANKVKGIIDERGLTVLALRKFWRKLDSIDEDIHESTFHFLDRATAEDF